MAISPAGDQIVYASEHGESRMLYRRFFEEDQSRPIPGTENAHSPFFSPDGASLGFYTPGKLQVLTASGIHTLVTLSPSFDRWNAIWADDGFIYFNGTIPGSNCWIWRVRALGGTPERLMDAGHDPHGDSFSFPTQLISGSHPKLLLSVDSGPVRRSVKHSGSEDPLHFPAARTRLGMPVVAHRPPPLLPRWQRLRHPL